MSGRPTAPPSVRIIPAAIYETVEAVEARARTEQEARDQQAGARVEAALHELSALRRELVRRSEKDIVCVIEAVARRVVGAELKTQPETLLRWVREAIDRLEGPWVVRVHPSDASLVMGLNREDLEVVADSTVSPGGCTVDDEGGRADAQVEVRLENVLAVLRVRHQEPPHG